MFQALNGLERLIDEFIGVLESEQTAQNILNKVSEGVSLSSSSGQDGASEVNAALLELCRKLCDCWPAIILGSPALRQLMNIAAECSGSVEHPATVQASLLFISNVFNGCRFLADASMRTKCVASLNGWLTQSPAAGSLLRAVVSGSIQGPTMLVDVNISLLHVVRTLVVIEH